MRADIGFRMMAALIGDEIGKNLPDYQAPRYLATSVPWFCGNNLLAIS